MGIAVCKNRCPIAGSTALNAAIPREETARFMERCCTAALDDGSRKSGAGEFMQRPKEAEPGGLTRPLFVYIHLPPHLSKRHCD